MKNIKKINTKGFALVFALMLAITSCSNWIDHDINTDPDSPSQVPMSLILPGVQQVLGYNLVGNDNVRTSAIWMQQFDGSGRQSATEARYQITPGDLNNLWRTLYFNLLINSKTIIVQAQIEGSESPNFEGVAQVITATTLGVITDMWGDVPFREALKGGENLLSPVYDSQEKVYDTIFEILDDAIVNLNNTNNTFELGGDVIYNNDISKWKKAANSVKARHLLQLSGKNGNAAYTAALAAVNNGFTSNDDDFLVPWEAANFNPFYQFIDQRGDIRMGATMVNMMAANGDDPRLPIYAAEDGDGNYTGSDPGSANADASEPGDYLGQTAPSRIMTYAELKFIEAECKFMLNQTGAQEDYEAAVAASVLRVTGSTNQAWLDANINGIPVDLETIITQKYIDGFTTNQPYCDYRRTGFPNLSLSEGAILGEIPSRFPYAQSEFDYNSEHVPSVQLTDRVWWNQ